MKHHRYAECSSKHGHGMLSCPSRSWMTKACDADHCHLLRLRSRRACSVRCIVRTADRPRSARRHNHPFPTASNPDAPRAPRRFANRPGAPMRAAAQAAVRIWQGPQRASSSIERARWNVPQRTSRGHHHHRGTRQAGVYQHASARVPVCSNAISYGSVRGGHRHDCTRSPRGRSPAHHQL